MWNRFTLIKYEWAANDEDITNEAPDRATVGLKGLFAVVMYNVAEGERSLHLYSCTWGSCKGCST